MLSTATALLDATKDSIFDEDIMGLAGELHTRRNELPDEIFAKYLFMYSSALSAKVADSITKILLTKEEIEEIVNMLKNPQKYEEAGAKLIRGVLLVGQPGTGKTLLARALAGESGINFIFLSASEFEQSLVGMGSIKLKKLFRYAKKNTPCIIFIDEIDSLLHKAKRSGYIYI